MKANFETGLKICGHCKRELPIEMFYKSSRTSFLFRFDKRGKPTYLFQLQKLTASMGE